MNQTIPWSFGGGVIVAAVAAPMIAAPERKDPAFDFIAGNRPVTEDQIRQKLVSDGWGDIQIVVPGRTLWLQHQKTAGLTPLRSIR
jgi:hypothetical protein